MDKCKEHQEIAIHIAEIKNDVKWIKENIKSSRAIYLWMFGALGSGIITIAIYLLNNKV